MKKSILFNASNLPALASLKRVLGKKVDSIDVFIQDDKISIAAIDISTGTNFLLQEVTPINTIDADGVTLKHVEGDFNFEWDGDELDGLDLLDELNEQVQQDLDRVNPTKKKEDTNIDVYEDMISFSVSSSFIDVLLAFKESYLEIEDKSLSIWSKDGLNSAYYKVSTPYINLNDLQVLKSGLSFSHLPTNQILPLLKVIERIEPVKYKQIITLDNDKAYMYGNFLACESKLDEFQGQFVLDSGIISIFKYSTSPKSSIYISKLQDGRLVLTIDGLYVFYSTPEIPTYNLLSEVADKKFLKIAKLSKDFSDSLKLADRFNTANNDLTIDFNKNGAYISSGGIVSHANTKTTIYATVDLDRKVLMYALDIVGKDPTISIWKEDEETIIIKLDGTISAIIEASRFVRNKID